MESEQPHRKKSFSAEVGEKEARKIKAQRDKPNVWSGFSLFGMIGWSIVIPTLLGALLGIWLDKRYQVDFSWTLSLLVGGLMVGCVIAWNWVNKENKGMHNNQNVDDE